MPDSHSDDRNRDDQLKPGGPPRPASEPPGSAASTRTSKTMTDPGSGESRPRPPRPNRAETDQTDGA